MLDKVDQALLTLDEDAKKTDKYLKDEIDNTIAACMSMDKAKILEAYNIRNGIRDDKDFKYLWEAYGIEFPSQMRHIPTLRTIFDSLIGQYIRRPFKYQITCSDQDSIKYMMDQHREQILREVIQYYTNRLQAAEALQAGGDDSEKLAQHIEKIKQKFEGNTFQTDLEILSSKMLRWCLQRFKLKSSLITMANDFITAGQAYYQTKVIAVGQKPLIRVINPMEIFYTKGHNTKFIKDCTRVVIREQMPVTQIWSLYGHKIAKKDQEKFIQDYGKYVIDADLELLAYDFGTISGSNSLQITKGINIPMMDVSYVEWLANTKVPFSEIDSTVESDNETKLSKLKTRFKYRLDRMEGTRIGPEIHVDYGYSKHTVRDPDDPSHMTLSVNGLCFNDRNGEPYSLPLKTKAIADKIDILHYHAENLMAISGTKAIMVNYPDIPEWMGSSPTKRIMKWAGYLKQGIALMDTSQESPGAGKFANMGDVDLSVSNAIIGIFTMIESLEATAYKITGVPRQAIGQISQSDGKGTTEIAINSSEVVTEPMFTEFDELAEAFLTDVVNVARIAYQDGIQGQLILGEVGQKLFTIKNKQFNLAHLNVFVNGEGDTQRDLDELKAVAYKLIDNQMLDVEGAIDMVTIKSLAELRKSLKDNSNKKDNTEKQQMSQQLEQLQGVLDKANKELEAFSKKDTGIKQQEIAVKQKLAEDNASLKNKELDQTRIFNDEKLKLDSKRVDLEALQLAEPNRRSREIKNN